MIEMVSSRDNSSPGCALCLISSLQILTTLPPNHISQALWPFFSHILKKLMSATAKKEKIKAAKQIHVGVSLKRSGFSEACVLEHNVGSLIGEDKAHSKHDYNPTPSL